MKSDKRSLRRQTLIIIMLLVLPFNILTAFLGGIMLTNAMESAELTVQSSLNSQMDNLDMRIQNTIYFLYDYPANHVSYINFLKQPRDWHYTFYRSLTVNELRDDLSLSTAAQYMFLYVESRDDLIIMNEEPYIRNESKLLLSEDDVLSRINDKTISDSRWHLVSIQDLPFLIMITQKEGVYLGACICMAEAVSEAAASSTFTWFRYLFAQSIKVDPVTVIGATCSPSTAPVLLTQYPPSWLQFLNVLSATVIVEVSVTAPLNIIPLPLPLRSKVFPVIVHLSIVP